MDLRIGWELRLSVSKYKNFTVNPLLFLLINNDMWVTESPQEILLQDQRKNRIGWK